ncbi:RICIN domain-containing protein [Streptomyces lavendulae]|uniref:RICIN domain-containing protein n=1 Tax=Streptomyces lavendulae TaxID=1914 RepID=UPI0036858140
MSLRDLAERYEGGKTLWGEYRSGAQLIPLPRLNSVVKDRVRDARGREAMLAKARQLHELAMTAEAESRPDIGLGEALQRAERDIADMGRLIKVLLGRIDVLQDEAAKQSPAAGGTDVSGRPVETIAAQLDVLRQHVAEARRVRDATLQAYDAAQSEAGEQPAGEGASAAAGSELVGSLADLHDTAARQQDAMRGWTVGSLAPGPEAVGVGTSSAPSGGGEEDDNGAGGGDSRGGSGYPDGNAGEQEAPAGEDRAAGTSSAGGAPAGGAPAGSGDAQDSPGARGEPSGSGPEPEGTRRRGMRLPAGVGLAVLVAACVIGGMIISGYQKGAAGERSPEARLNTPATPGAGPRAPAIEVPTPQSSGPSAEPTPSPSATGPADEGLDPVTKPDPQSPGPAPVESPKEQAQKPKPAPPPPVVGGGLRTWMNAGTQMCLEIRRSAGEDGATANQWTCNNSSSQKWTTVNPAGWTTLVHMDSGKCLEIRADSVEDGAAANQWTCNNSPTQSWRWQAQPGGGWSLVNANSGKCLTIRGQGDGALAVQQPCDGSPAQTWN